MSSVATRSTAAQGSGLDDFMRRLLRVRPAPSPVIAREATRAMSSSIALSGFRCLLTYLIIPVLGPAVHLSNAVGRPVSIALCVLAAYFSIRSMRRFWTANHRYRWAYTSFATVVLAYMTYGVVSDLSKLG